ncbi:MAG: ABC transporter permease [Saccharofermentanales bacterium]|jgi:ribose transport system permease protein|nr:ABC transporter permease [Clostridiaceae bacterium]
MLKKYWDVIKNYFPLLGFFLVVAFFAITTDGGILRPLSLQSILNSTMTGALVSLGAVFVFGSGNFDMSLGGAICLTAVLGGYAAIATGSILVAFLVCMGVSLALGILKGLFAAFVDVPLFIVTIVLGFILTAIVLVMMGDTVSIYLSEAVTPIRSFTFAEMTTINIVVLGAYFILCLILFNYTPLGRQIKIQGGNPITARQSGINSKKVKLIVFIISAIGVALAAFIILIRVRSVGTATGSSLGMDVLVALVLGGMPLMGGPRSRISAGIIGAATISVLNAGLTMMGLELAVIQISRAIIFLAVVYVASMTYQTKLLTR